MRIDRRGLLIGGGVGVGLVLGWALWPDGRAPLPAPEGSAEIAGLLHLEPSGAIRLHVPQVEYGQGIWTALAQACADAMGARMSQLSVQPLQAGAGHDNPPIDKALGLNVRFTGAGTSIRGFVEPMRAAGASAKAMLLAQAREITGSNDLRVEAGQVLGGPRPLGFEELVEGAAARRVPNETPGAWSEGGLLGTPAQRVDTLPKVRGDWRFASDVRLPDMVFAAARIAPAGRRVTGLDRAAASRLPGDVELVEEADFVAAVGQTAWAAERALSAARVRFTTGELGDSRIEAALDLSLTEGDGVSIVDNGDAAGAIAAAQAPIAARYSAAPLQHHGLEPVAAAARVRSDGGIDIYAGTLAPDRTRAAVAQATDLALGQVRLIPMGVGETSGRMIENDAAPVAARLARRLGKPVQLVLSPTANNALGPICPPMLARVSASLGNGRLDALAATFVSMPQLAPSLGGKGWSFARPVLPYSLPNLSVDVVDAALPLRTGWHRGGETRLLAFALESMVDEAARRLNAEPLSFRVGMLGSDLRMTELLRRAADMAEWDGGGTGSSMGIACASIDGSRIALVAQAALEEGRIRVSRLSAAVDCGAVVNPGLVEQQVAGGMLSALADTIAPAPKIEAGLARSLPRGAPALRDLPQVDVAILPSDAPPGGASQLGSVVLAPALANALAAGQGPRLRRLPFAAI